MQLYILPNGKIIYNNNSLYYNDQVLRILNNTDLQNINDNITLQKPVYGVAQYSNNKITINIGFQPSCLLLNIGSSVTSAIFVYPSMYGYATGRGASGKYFDVQWVAYGVILTVNSLESSSVWYVAMR